MNPGPDFNFWLRLGGGLAAEAALVTALAALLAARLRPPAWQRSVWRAAFLALVLLLAAEVTGLGHFLSRKTSQPQPRNRVVARGNLPVTTDASEFAPDTFTPRPVAKPESPSPAPPPPPPPRPLWWPGWLWLLGCGALLTRLAAGRVLLAITGWRRHAVTDAELLQQVESLRGRLAFRARVRLVEFNGLRSPVAFGALRPAIGLPAGFASRHAPAQCEAMLAHELAHLAARDPFWHGVAELVTAALWWHPLVWWARRRLHAASEAAADEASLAVDNGPAALAECLVALGRQLAVRRAWGWLGVEGGGYRSDLGRRVERLLKLDGALPRPVGVGGKVGLFLAFGVAAVLGVSVSTWALPVGGTTLSLAALVEATLNNGATTEPAARTNDVSFSRSEQDGQRPSTTPGSDGVAFSARAATPSAMHTRTFRVDTNAIPQPYGARGAYDFYRSLLGTNGVDWSSPPGKALFFTESQGMVIVRATEDDLAVIEAVLQPQRNSSSTARSSAEGTNRPSSGTAELSGAQFEDLVKELEKLTGLKSISAQDIGWIRNRETGVVLTNARRGPVSSGSVLVWNAQPAGATGVDVVEVKYSGAPLGIEGNEWHFDLRGQVHVMLPAGVSMSTATPAPESRVFKVNPGTLITKLGGSPLHQAGSESDIQAAIRAFLNSQGVDFLSPRGEEVYFNERHGTLLVRRPHQDWDTVEKAIQALNTPPASTNAVLQPRR